MRTNRYEADGYTVQMPTWPVPDGMVPLTREHYDLAFAQAALDKKQAA